MVSLRVTNNFCRLKGTCGDRKCNIQTIVFNHSVKFRLCQSTGRNLGIHLGKISSTPTPMTSHGSPVTTLICSVSSPAVHVTSSVSDLTSPILTVTSPVTPHVLQICNQSKLSVQSVMSVSIQNETPVSEAEQDNIDNTGIAKVSKSQYLYDRGKMEEESENNGMKSVLSKAQCLSLGEPFVLYERQFSNDTKHCTANKEKEGKQNISKTETLHLSVSLRGNKDKALPRQSNPKLKEDTVKNISETVLDAFYSKREPHDTEGSSDEGSSGSDNCTLSSETDLTIADPVKLTRKKKIKKLRLYSLLPTLKRSQSEGCEGKLSVGHCPQGQACSKLCDAQDAARRVIHKTCSADATLMMSEVLPIDPQELMKNKQKSSIARNMRKRLLKLKRRNTDSLLGAAVMTMRGKITQSDAAQWAASFDQLLADKNGLDLFQSFLKSEFSEENIEFWIACEEFKTIRTNKLASKAQKIYSEFIAINAPKQVNLDSKTRLETVTNLEHPTRDLFRQAQKRIQFLMENDSYKRFLDSDTYKNIILRYSSSESK